MNRVRLYRTYERRWAAACIILCLVFLLACCGVIGFAMAKLPWLAIGCGGLIPLLWTAWMRCIANCTYWSQRKYAEILFLDRETPPPVPDALMRDLCGNREQVNHDAPIRHE